VPPPGREANRGLEERRARVQLGPPEPQRRREQALEPEAHRVRAAHQELERVERREQEHHRGLVRQPERPELEPRRGPGAHRARAAQQGLLRAGLVARVGWARAGRS